MDNPTITLCIQTACALPSDVGILNQRRIWIRMEASMPNLWVNLRISRDWICVVKYLEKCWSYCGQVEIFWNQNAKCRIDLAQNRDHFAKILLTKFEKLQMWNLWQYNFEKCRSCCGMDMNRFYSINSETQINWVSTFNWYHDVSRKLIYRWYSLHNCTAKQLSRFVLILRKKYSENGVWRRKSVQKMGINLYIRFQTCTMA